jgi:O-antigen/teichoic acid export membrane protein
MAKPETIATYPPRLGWRTAVASLRAQRSGRSRILGGSMIMLFGSTLVSLINFGYNMAVAHMLGPAEFGHAAAAVTLLMLVSCITLAFQLVCAKFVAKNETAGAKAAVYRSLLRQAWLVGMVLGSVLILGSGLVGQYLNLPSPWVVILLAFGIAFYIPLGVRRGGMQGVCQFSRLTTNFLIEAAVKFVAAVVLVETGFGILGAVAAISASVVLAYFVPSIDGELEARPAAGGLPASFHEGMQAIVFFIGQVVINNVDILLVKHFFDASSAGMYAAIALVGRVLYFASWSVVSAMFPISAGAKPKEENAAVLVVPLLFVLCIAVVFILGLGIFPDLVLRTVFGNGFHSVGRGLDSLLSLYAAATGTYSISVVLMAYEMSRRIANTGWLQLVFSGAIVLGIYFFHDTLYQVVMVQLVLMVLLLVAVSVPFFRVRSTQSMQEAA